MTAKLKPCPFCGNKATLKKEGGYGHGAGFVYYQVGCKQCRFKMESSAELPQHTGLIRKHRAELFNKWNRRAA